MTPFPRRALLAATLAAPALARAQGAAILRFVPQSDATVLDPLWSTAFVSRNHATLVYDTLYGTDAEFRPQPQMAEGQFVEDGDRIRAITRRAPSRCHDNETMRGADAVASRRRWSARDASGQALFADDRRRPFRLNAPSANGLDPCRAPTLALAPRRRRQTCRNAQRLTARNTHRSQQRNRPPNQRAYAAATTSRPRKKSAARSAIASVVA